jgi:hypothetical protein
MFSAMVALPHTITAQQARRRSIAGASVASSNNEFHLTMIEDAGLINRLTTELREVAQASQLTWPEFKRDPVGFTRRSAAAYGTLTWRFFRGPNVALACLIALFTVISAIVIIGLLDRRTSQLALNDPDRVDQILDFTEVPEEQPKEKPDKGVGDKRTKGVLGSIRARAKARNLNSRRRRAAAAAVGRNRSPLRRAAFLPLR